MALQFTQSSVRDLNDTVAVRIGVAVGGLQRV